MPGKCDDGGGHADEAKLGEQLRLDGSEGGLLQVEDHGRAGPERHPELHAELGGNAQQGCECQILHTRKEENVNEAGKKILDELVEYLARRHRHESHSGSCEARHSHGVPVRLVEEAFAQERTHRDPEQGQRIPLPSRTEATQLTMKFRTLGPAAADSDR